MEPVDSALMPNAFVRNHAFTFSKFPTVDVSFPSQSSLGGQARLFSLRARTPSTFTALYVPIPSFLCIFACAASFLA
jgi:hypothetical protein